MLKVIKYQTLGINRAYNQATGIVEDVEMLATVIIPYSEENEDLAKQVAYNGEYIVEDQLSCL